MLYRGRIGGVRGDASKTSKAGAAKNFGVVESQSDGVLKFSDAVWDAPQAAVPAIPIAGGKIEQDLLESMLIQLLSDGFGRIVVREEVFNALKSSGGGGAKPVEEIDFVKHQCQICGKPYHL